jgi:hypothetical protein
MPRCTKYGMDCDSESLDTPGDPSDGSSSSSSPDRANSLNDTVSAAPGKGDSYMLGISWAGRDIQECDGNVIQH